ncbi:hypothetical protein L1987_59541 [Smallanthus sonchifolius]|uniref:Uncharacterized protein n=1 Tax=Smallanthus sonchifolius TaxID=185202 RepID=A0ACB9D5H9_9ASTR|nr:hypothetical protein L1987_59541 [Smallanthus sonchifolius]
MERKLKHKQQSDVPAQLRDRRPQHSPPVRTSEDSTASFMPSLSSLSHGFTPDRVEEEPEPRAEVEPSSPVLDLLPGFQTERVRSPTPILQGNQIQRIVPSRTPLLCIQSLIKVVILCGIPPIMKKDLQGHWKYDLRGGGVNFPLY